MSKTWTFIGGMLAGVASVFVTAAVAVALEYGKACSADCKVKEKLALPEGEA